MAGACADPLKLGSAGSGVGSAADAAIGSRHARVTATVASAWYWGKVVGDMARSRLVSNERDPSRRKRPSAPGRHARKTLRHLRDYKRGRFGVARRRSDETPTLKVK